ncbi:hypothetical protein ATCCBAA256_21300 [Mycobacterium montefiorense]|nr:hypothetical protein ATCCBAA256_21300 [Mycobacterium montefiorense]
MPLSAMESGPSVRCVFAGVGISDRRSVGAADVVVACDTEVVIVLVPVVLLLDAVLELGELLHAAATRPMAIAAAAETNG